MRTYEALYIVSPELDDDGIQTVDKEVQDLITANGGSIVRSEIWGKRRLAYPVKKHTEGTYILLRFTANPEFVKRLEAWYKLSEAVIRYLVVNFDERTLRLEEEQNRRREAEISGGGRSSHDDDDDDDDRDDRRRPARAGAHRSRRDDDDDDD